MTEEHDDSDELDALRGTRPRVAPPDERVIGAARRRLLIRARASRVHRRRVRWGIAGAGAAVVAATSLLVASLAPENRPLTPPTAHAIEITRKPDDGYVIRFVDVTQASADDINRQLRDAGLHVEVHLVPASPSMVGTVGAVAMGHPNAGRGGQVFFGNEFHGPFASTDPPSVKFQRRDRLEIEPGVATDAMLAERGMDLWVGRPARPDEPFVLQRDSAERFGEAASCAKVYGRTASEVEAELRARDVRVIWRTEDAWPMHALLEREMYGDESRNSGPRRHLARGCGTRPRGRSAAPSRLARVVLGAGRARGGRGQDRADSPSCRGPTARPGRSERVRHRDENAIRRRRTRNPGRHRSSGSLRATTARSRPDAAVRDPCHGGPLPGSRVHDSRAGRFQRGARPTRRPFGLIDLVPSRKLPRGPTQACRAPKLVIGEGAPGTDRVAEVAAPPDEGACSVVARSLGGNVARTRLR